MQERVIHDSEGFITVYTDGSHSERDSKIGCGWIIKDQSKYKLHSEHSHGEEVGSNPKTLSTYAEYKAVLLALQALSKKSKIIIHADEQTLVDFINKDCEARNRVIHGTPPSQFKNTLIELSDAIDQHEDVSGKYVNHRNPKNYEEKRLTRMAHNKAAEKSGSKKRKHVPHKDPKKEDKWHRRVGLKIESDRTTSMSFKDTTNPLNEGTDDPRDFPDPRDAPLPKPKDGP